MKTTLDIEDIGNIHLSHGSHKSPADGYCLLEAVSMFAKEPFTDQPQCVSPYLRSFGIGLNDRASDKQRQDLQRFIPLVVGTAGDGMDEQRRWLAADHITRVLTPKWLDRANLPELAAKLREVTPITDRATWLEAHKAIEDVRNVTWPLRQNRWQAIRDTAVKAWRENQSADADAAAVAAAVAAADADAAAVAAADAVAAAAADADADADAVADADADAAADAVAVAAAAAAADADAVAVAAADAVAAAAAAADADARYSDRWYETRRKVYAEVYPKVRALYEERFGDLVSESWSDAVGLYERLIDPSAARAGEQL